MENNQILMVKNLATNMKSFCKYLSSSSAHVEEKQYNTLSEP